MSKPVRESNSQRDSDGVNTKRAAKRRKIKRPGEVSPTWNLRNHIRAVNKKTENKNPDIKGRLSSTPHGRYDDGMSFLW